jgi:ketosteroid isomerase-like protein
MTSAEFCSDIRVKGRSKFNMNQSSELKNVVLHFYEGLSKGDLSVIEHLFSRQKGVLAIGTDLQEWWTDYNAIVQAFRKDLEMDTPPIHAGDLHAFAEGSVGWAADRRTVQLPNGKDIVVRDTLVFHKEDSEWKIVQFHISLAKPDSDISD